MADVTNELLLEHLKRINTKLAEHDTRFDDLGLRLTRVETTLAHLLQQGGTEAEAIAHLQAQADRQYGEIARINRRLEINDSPSS